MSPTCVSMTGNAVSLLLKLQHNDMSAIHLFFIVALSGNDDLPTKLNILLRPHYDQNYL